MRRISDLFRHEGRIYIYCSSVPVRRMLERDLDEQGFAFGDGVRVTERPIDELMAIQRDFTVCFCGYASHVRCGSLRNPVYVREDASRGCTRVDYARFIGGAEAYVIRGPQDSRALREDQRLPAGSCYVWD